MVCPPPPGPILYGSLADIHLRLLFICLCAVRKEAEGKRAWAPHARGWVGGGALGNVNQRLRLANGSN